MSNKKLFSKAKISVFDHSPLSQNTLQKTQEQKSNLNTNFVF